MTKLNIIFLEKINADSGQDNYCSASSQQFIFKIFGVYEEVI